MVYRRSIIFVVLLGVLSAARPIGAQNPVDQSVERVLGAFDTRISALLNKSQNTGDLLIARVALELRIATNNLGLLLDDQRNALIKDLSPEIQNVFSILNSTTEKAERGIADIKRLEEYMNLDVQEILNRLPFVKDKDFYISSVSPLTLAQKDGGDYLVTVRGIGFGYDESDRRYKTRVIVAGKELAATAIARPRQHELVLRLPSDQLVGLFDERKPALAPVKLVTEISKKRVLWGSWKRYEMAFDLLLFPKLMGELTVSETITVRTLGPESKEVPVITRVEGCKTDAPCRPTGNKCVEQNKVIVGVQYDCQGESCGYCFNSEARGGNYAVNFQVTDNGTCFTWSRFCDGWSPSNFYHYPVTRTYQSQTQERVIGTYPLYLGRPLTVPLDPTNPTCFWRYSAKLRTGETGGSNAGIVGSVTPLVRFVGSGKVGDHCEANFVLDLPGDTR